MDTDAPAIIKEGFNAGIMQFLIDHAPAVAAFVTQSIGFIIWLVRMDDRVRVIERSGSPQMTMLSDRLSRMEEKMIALTFLVSEYNKKIDLMTERLERFLLKRVE